VERALFSTSEPLVVVVVVAGASKAAKAKAKAGPKAGAAPWGCFSQVLRAGRKRSEEKRREERRGEEN